MEETQLTPQTEQQKGCANCGNPAVLNEYPTKLCTECREQFIRYPVPKWLWFFAGGIGVIVLFSLFTLPRSISVGVAIEKGKKAEWQHRYLTAQKAYEQVVAKVPGYIEGRGHLMIASFYNGDFETFIKSFGELKDKEIEDKELFARLDGLMGKAANYLANDTFRQFATRYDSLRIAVPDSALRRYISLHPDDMFAQMSYALNLFDKEQYAAADSISAILISQDAEYTPALNMRAAAQRELGNYTASLQYCGKMLDIDKEDFHAIASRARTNLKMKKDKEALKLSLEAYDLKKDGYDIATLALAYHYNNDYKKRDEVLGQYKTDSSMAYYINYARDVINKKEKFRD